MQTVLEVKIIQTQELIPQVPIIIITTVAVPDHHQAEVTAVEDHLVAEIVEVEAEEDNMFCE